MAWYTLKVLVSHEATIRREIVQAFLARGLEVRVALPVIPGGRRLRGKAPTKRSGPTYLNSLQSRDHKYERLRMVKLSPGFLFARLRLEHLPEALEIFEAIRGIGAVDSCAGLPRPVAEPQAGNLERGRFKCDHSYAPLEYILT